jgi:hypothetical protein
MDAPKRRLKSGRETIPAHYNNILREFGKEGCSTKVIGGREGARTLGLSVANAALSQLSYAPTPSLH